MNSEDLKIMGGASVPTHEKVMKINTKQVTTGLQFIVQQPVNTNSKNSHSYHCYLLLKPHS